MEDLFETHLFSEEKEVRIVFKDFIQFRNFVLGCNELIEKKEKIGEMRMSEEFVNRCKILKYWLILLFFLKN